MRLIFASIFGGLSSLIILVPTNSNMFSFISSIVVSFVTSFIAFGKYKFIKTAVVLYAANCTFCGISMLLWMLTESSNITINNSIVYINISPLTLIISSAAVYVIISVLKRYIAFNSTQNHCNIIIYYNDICVTALCLIDSGNLLKDNITEKPITIIDKKLATEILQTDISNLSNLHNIKGFRIIPTKSVGGNKALYAFKPDKIYIETENKTLKIDSLIAISDDIEKFNAIISTYAISLGEEINYAQTN